MKYMFIIILVLISIQAFAETEIRNCMIHYKASNESISQPCIKRDLIHRDTFTLIGVNGAPLGDDVLISVIRSRDVYLQLIVKTTTGEIYDLGAIRKDFAKPGCYNNRYYVICLK